MRFWKAYAIALGFVVLVGAAATYPNQLLFKASGTGAVSRQMSSKLGDVMSVKDFGAVGDGVTDDTTAIQAAITAGAGGIVDFPAPSVSYKVTGTLTVSTAGTTLRGNNSKIYMAHTDSGPSGGILLSITASNVDVNGLWIDSTGSATSAATINHYGIKAVGTSGTHLANVKIRNGRFTSIPWTYYPPSGVGSVFATHAVYAQYVDGLTVKDNRFDTIGGAAIYVSASTKADVLDNSINDTQWYSIQFSDQVAGALIRGNRITGTMSQCRLWGGSINLMSNSATGAICGTPGCATISRVEISHNYISGAHSYTSAVHIESSSHVSFHDNIMEGIYLTQPSDFYSNPTPPTYVRIYVRAASGSTNEGASDHIDVSHNDLTANGVSGIGIYADAQDNGSGSLAYSDTLDIRDNKIQSKDTSNYFAKAILVHGQQGGWKNVSIVNNDATGFPDSASPVDGFIGVQGLSAAPSTDLRIVGNTLDVVGGTASTSTHIGIAVQAYAQRVAVDHNIVKNFYYGVRTFTNSSTIYYGINNLFTGSVSADTLFGVAPSAQAFATIPTFGLTPAVASTGETVLGPLGVSDVSSSTGFITFKNGTTTDATFYPFLDFGSSSTLPAFSGRGNIITDTGLEGVWQFNSRLVGTGAVGTRPLFQARNNGTNYMSLSAAGGLTISGGATPALILGAVTQANLGTPANGTVIYCSDCTIANPCAAAGTGAIAKRLNGVWVCN